MARTATERAVAQRIGPGAAGSQLGESMRDEAFCMLVGVVRLLIALWVQGVAGAQQGSPGSSRTP